MKRLVIPIVALIVYGSLYPWHFRFAGAPANPLLVLLHAWPPVAWDRFALRDAIVNVLLYLPFGAAAMWALPHRIPRAAGAAAALFGAMALSASMEMTQVYVPGRVCSLFDVLSNTAGGAAGIAVALLYHPAPTGSPRRAAIPAGGWLILALFAGYQLYPFFPILSQTRLLHAVERLRAAEGFSLNEVWCSAGEWLAALVVLEAVLDAAGLLPSRLWPTLAALCLPLRMVVPDRTLALHEVLGALLGWLAWMLLRRRLRLRAAVWVLGAAIVLRELAPFHLASAPSAFVWIPFRPTFDSERHSALVILARKAFDYGAMVWLLRANGVSWARAGAAVAAVLAVLEAAQRWLPGRTPETTDAVLTLLLTFFLWSLDNFPRRRGLA
jgi:VanZ family protein